jgi:hypothetical protein
MTRWPVVAWVVLLAAGCEISVGSSDKSGTGSTSGTTDPSDPVDGDDDDDDDNGTGTTPNTTDTPTTGTPGDCAGVFPGDYGGADQGAFEATVDPAAMTIAINGVDASAQFFDGVLDVASDGTVYGESQGYWMDGTIDLATCEMSGGWGVVELPGVDAGWWEAGP